ncbi:uncharacterized protein CELE_C28D4.18 [Caenorhabditis elegans]|uniref:Uncharacterized protein n=1 Tax=Caenorhabditis elegans TaxID=6239 RepID=A0A2K5ATX9_CAEEL|nr:Uncharacterized protein CELE_C28D4.18 [Caenorhabditis elegans]SPC47644.1 Uncharacterized protein CELE_C28D4.18 [Caenorhabditis elegans]|eukprot:NP_001348760.1 Uncharacterized protein CELE_C28D4.18 [Caenorhabditis elegans]
MQTILVIIDFSF